jgi:SAM-dependent methyltransferase
MLKNCLQKYFPFLFSSKSCLAFGVEKSPTQYPLDKARYLTMASYIHEESLKHNPPLRVLDIGCSEGMMLLYCRRNGTQAAFYGMDILQERLNMALQRGYQSVSLQDIRNYPFPYPDHFFDVVICSHILEHLEHPENVLQELDRIMKSGGLLVAGIPVGLFPGIWWRKHMTPRYKPHKRKEVALKQFGHVSFFTLPAFKKLLRAHGFETEEARGDFLIRARKFFLENYHWWFRFNQWYGKHFPGVLGHVTLKARLRHPSSAHS